MKTVGITGGIGSGKSTVCKIFEVLNIPVYAADDRAKFLMQYDPSLIKQITNTFGEASYSNGTLNRSHLANVIFSNPKETEKINALVHPVVAQDFGSWRAQQHSPYVLKEAALLIESGSYQSLDFLINVYAPIDTRIHRVQQRDPQRSIDEIKGIIDKQTSEERRTAVANAIINNDGNQLLIPQVLAIHQQLIS
ncbi:dephospho-CoA kinase [Reichenbachiella carrageenanivorans]|uniref:Dephospho-CoA kinase n=1 Tax=Reichenbachiella carrageenanivorans TaxID=2979869 RepID=A0ABY6D1P1_9BACT|nr:dephospho-CoA kinase [Reichenbachiella carrageenanivorans]UXX80082.1 dephospho-CoA kinase [Reichenbachiella carrageenanivorans]